MERKGDGLWFWLMKIMKKIEWHLLKLKEIREKIEWLWLRLKEIKINKIGLLLRLKEIKREWFWLLCCDMWLEIVWYRQLGFGLGWSRLYRTLIESERDKRKGEGLWFR